jgi:membrane protein DedA with SNARE-associated domain
MRALIDRYGMLLVLLFALLPLPDDVLLVPLGMIKYNLWKLVSAMFLGKTLMCLAISYAGFYSYGSIMELFESGGTLGVVASLALLALVIVAVLRFDWEGLLDSVQGTAEK